MQRYFSHICDGTDVQADWRRSCTYGRALNAMDISPSSLTCPSYTDTGPPFLYGDSDTPPHLVALYDTLGIRRMYSRLNPPPPRRPHGGCFCTTFLSDADIGLKHRLELFVCARIYFMGFYDMYDMYGKRLLNLLLRFARILSNHISEMPTVSISSAPMRTLGLSRECVLRIPSVS